MRAVGWIAWFTDDRVFNSRGPRDEDWRDLPNTGLLVLMLYAQKLYRSGRYRAVFYGKDNYVRVPPGKRMSEFFLTNRPENSILAEHPRAQIKVGSLVTVPETEEKVRLAFASRWPPS